MYFMYTLVCDLHCYVSSAEMNDELRTMSISLVCFGAIFFNHSKQGINHTQMYA